MRSAAAIALQFSNRTSPFALIQNNLSLEGNLMKRVLLILLLATPFIAHSQDSTKAPEWGWKHSLVSSLNLTQVAFTDWAQGGENALAWALSLEGKSVNDQEKSNWSNSYKFAFGQARLGNLGLRKTDDKIDLETIYTFKLGEYINPYAAATMKSQFAQGYKYDDEGNKTPVSKFFDPGYLTQSVGAEYQPIPEFKTRLGVALREIFTSEFTGYADDPATTEIEKSRVEGGLESVSEVAWKLDDNILFTSKLELFAPFETLDEIVVRNDNTIAASVSKYITVNLNVQLINEKQISPRTQIKETLAIGITYKLL